ncbi:MAG: MAP_0585 family protein [Mycobacterium sp.]
MKRRAGAAVVAASVGVAAFLGAGLATAEPCEGGKTQNCQPATGGATPAPAQTHESTPAPAQTHESTPAPTQTHESTPAPTQSHESTPAPSPTQQSKSPQGSEPKTTEPSERGRESKSPESSAPQTTEPSEHGRESKTSESATSSAPTTTERNHPRPPPFVPSGKYERGNAQVGGPTDLEHGFSVPGHGAPPSPRQRGPGWNDGPAPGGPPPNWDGPPPQGGWNAPQPPPGGWNQRYDHPGPPRDVARARDDFGYFEYNGYSAMPTFNPWFGGWGYWYFGVWIPLY